jgi:P27 family predicted phage terminase small subunit
MAKRGPKTTPKTAVNPGPLPDPPAFVDSSEALAIWHQYAPALNRLGLLETLDAIAFGMLCDACVAYVQARDQLSPDNLVITVGEFGAEQQNPLVSIIRQQSKAVREFLGEFGMTPGSRSALTGSTSATPGQQEVDPLEALMSQFGQSAPPKVPDPPPVTPRRRQAAKKKAAKKKARKPRASRSKG